MPKAAKAASRATRGGYSTRRPQGDRTPTGRPRSAPRWTAAAAITFTKALYQAENYPKEGKTAVIRRVLSSEQDRDAISATPAMRTVAPETRELAEAIMDCHREKVQKTLAKKGPLANLIRERLLEHTGPQLEAESCPVPRTPAADKAPGWWLNAAQNSATGARPVPDKRSTRCKEIKSWGLERAGPLPDHSIIVYDRTKGRVDEWRKKNGKPKTAAPPSALARALVHTDIIPTALAQPGDHWYLVGLDRWVTPEEGLRIFGAAEGSSIAKAVKDAKTGLDAIATMSALGRSIKLTTCRKTLALAELDNLDHPLRYGSAFSGIDLFAAAVEERHPDMIYAHGAEASEPEAKALAATYSGKGLSIGNALADATAIRDVRPVDLWVATPPCEDYSKRNHKKNPEKRHSAI